ncbi:MAG: YoaK family protein [Ruminococcus sp.]
MRGSNRVQMSESIPVGFLLALSGGFMDAYSYMCRGEVFANAQTGNLMLMGISISQGDFQVAMSYFCPVFAFVAGIFIANVLRHYFIDYHKICWKQLCTIAEAVFLFGASFVPQELNLLANSMISFACGVQVQAFRKISGNNIATTMCIGNLRSAICAISDSLFLSDKSMVKKGCFYLMIIGVFVIGAVLGNLCVDVFGEKAIIISALLIFASFLLMFFEKNENSKGIKGERVAE